jgi:hypothetical protein
MHKFVTGYLEIYDNSNEILNTSIQIKESDSFKVEAWARLRTKKKIETRCSAGLSFYDTNCKIFMVSGIYNKYMS